MEQRVVDPEQRMRTTEVDGIELTVIKRTVEAGVEVRLRVRVRVPKVA